MKENRNSSRKFAIIVLIVFSAMLLGNVEKFVWKTITLEECGTIQVPPSWTLVDDQDGTVIYDRDGIPVLVQFNYIEQLPDGSYRIQWKQSGEEQSDVITIRSSIAYSNSSIMTTTYGILHEKNTLVNVVEFWGASSWTEMAERNFLVSSEVSPYTLKKIAKSYWHF